MDRATALAVSGAAFPRGPEALAERMGAEIVVQSLDADGYCVRRPNGRPPLVRLNSRAPHHRRRFTLAHELAHLVLRTTPDVTGTRGRDVYSPRSPEERAANQLASELLLPLDTLDGLLARPVDSRSIARAAKECDVSEVVLVLRLSRSALRFRLEHPSVMMLTEDAVAWRVPPNGGLSDARAVELYRAAVDGGGTHRVTAASGDILLLCALSNRTYPVLFSYILGPDEAACETPAERRVRIESELFRSDASARQVLASCFSWFKNRPFGSLDDAVDVFHQGQAARIEFEFPDVWASPHLDEYIRIRLQALIVLQ